MEISLLQAFALGIIAFIAGLDMFNGLTHMHRRWSSARWSGWYLAICIPEF